MWEERCSFRLWLWHDPQVITFSLRDKYYLRAKKARAHFSMWTNTLCTHINSAQSYEETVVLFFIFLFWFFLIHAHKETPQKTKKSTENPLTGALLLIAGPDLLSWAFAGVTLYTGTLAHPEAPLPPRFTCLAAQTPVVPAAPVTSTWHRNNTSEVQGDG